MEKAKSRILEYVVLVSLLVVGLIFFRYIWYIKNPDIYFCQRVFRGLVGGNYQVAKFIDWQNLKALDIDVGATYNQLANEKERQDYKKAFIQSFSMGFKNAGGRLNAFTHWRIYDKSPETAIVAADYKDKGKTILFTLSKYAGKELLSIQWEKTDAP